MILVILLLVLYIFYYIIIRENPVESEVPKQDTKIIKAENSDNESDVEENDITKENKIKEAELRVQYEESAKVEASKKEEIEMKALEDSSSNNVVTTEGPLLTEEEEIEVNLDAMVNQFIRYIQKKKIVKIDELSAKFNSDKEETVNKLRELESNGDTFGFVNSSGQYINLTIKELQV
jgi:hypothetical protein